MYKKIKNATYDMLNRENIIKNHYEYNKEN